MTRPASSLGFVLALSLVGLAGCHRSRNYESVCQVVRQDVVERNEKGETTLVDVELEWDPCPGDQFQVLRGGKDFAACMSKYKEGDLIPVRVTHAWDSRGYYAWDIYQAGDCKRTIEEASEGSYEKSQECSDKLEYGEKQGFVCSRRPFAKLVSKCPWMARN